MCNITELPNFEALPTSKTVQPTLDSFNYMKQISICGICAIKPLFVCLRNFYSWF